MNGLVGDGELTQGQKKQVYKHLYTAFWKMAECESGIRKANQEHEGLHPTYEGLEKVTSGFCEMLQGLANAAREEAGIAENSAEDRAIQRAIDKIKV